MFRSQAIPGYGHNPVVRRAPDNMWLIYFIRKDKSDISMAWSDSLYGPWEVRSILTGGLRHGSLSPSYGHRC